MITQQDVHNHIVLNANDWQKRYLSMQCGNDVEKLKEVEKSMANMVNGVVKALRNSGVDYLNKIVWGGLWNMKRNGILATGVGKR